MHGTALTALDPLVFPRISTEIGLVLAPAVDGMLSQPVVATLVSKARAIHRFGAVEEFSAFSASSLALAAAIADGTQLCTGIPYCPSLWIAHG